MQTMQRQSYLLWLQTKKRMSISILSSLGFNMTLISLNQMFYINSNHFMFLAYCCSASASRNHIHTHERLNASNVINILPTSFDKFLTYNAPFNANLYWIWLARSVLEELTFSFWYIKLVWQGTCGVFYFCLYPSFRNATWRSIEISMLLLPAAATFQMLNASC